ncbi:autotransporter serine protease [Solilutibacter pythonis]|uniref:autotransporter serine protease n=1 Tax=Solilutibacter pythonis TaxID=2483112 RepID=UPI001314D278|nr:autotransporter serine protease [Lysobacter pythonis]
MDRSLIDLEPPPAPDLVVRPALADARINQHLILTNAAGALANTRTGAGVTIGLVDSGVNRRHVTLNGRVVANLDNRLPPGNNTRVDDVTGHGTTVASLAAGRPVLGNYTDANGKVQSTSMWGGGVAPDALIASYRILGDRQPKDDGSGQGTEVKAGNQMGAFFQNVNRELADKGARIINNSWGGFYWNDPALTLELANAWKDFVVNRGGLVVFANGNAGEDQRYAHKPSNNAMLPSMDGGDPVLERGWLTVGALDPDKPTQLAGYSQQCGPAMNYCLVAPGTNVFIAPDATNQAGSTLLRGGGTSYAAPLVSGAAALVWSQFSWMSNDQVRQTLLGTAKDLGAPGVDPVFGWGLLDVTRASYGPGAFAWGDFNANFSGAAIWRNDIYGTGGLIKDGNGTLLLLGSSTYLGGTHVKEGSLYIARDHVSSGLKIDKEGMVWMGGNVGQVDNGGFFIVSGQVKAKEFNQTGSGNLGVFLGRPLQVAGAANLAGTVSVLGVKKGYVTTAKEKLLQASEINGRFGSVKAATNVFLDASLSYDAQNVYLDIRRIDVSRAVASMGIGGAALDAAARVEGAFNAIDSGSVGRDSGFAGAAGDLQRTTFDAASAERALRSLGGQMHAANLALTLESMDAGRRAMAGRFDALAGNPRLQGSWSRDLRAGGELAQAGFSGLDYQLSGWMMGTDRRIGTRGVLGMAASHGEGMGWMSGLGDRTRNRQTEAQAYAGWTAGQAWWRGGVGIGRFERDMERRLLFGLRNETVNSVGRGQYLFANAETGWRADPGKVALSPYLGTQFAQVSSGGLSENGGEGFGLRVNAWRFNRWQAYAGLRANREWRLGGMRLGVDGRLEWQRTLSESGQLFASFSALEQWMPVTAMSLARQQRLLGLGLSLNSARDGGLRLDASHRRNERGSDALLQASWRQGF